MNRRNSRLSLSRVTTQSMDLFSSTPTTPEIEQNQLKTSRTKRDIGEAKKKWQHKVGRLMISVKCCTTCGTQLSDGLLDRGFAMNGQKQTESIDWKIRELMILIASVHDFNFFHRRR